MTTNYDQLVASIKSVEKQNGKFVVIDGTDGSGKATQTLMLADRLKAEGYQVEMADFPQYGKKSASMVEEYLNGKYGEADAVGPYRASIFYAVDRYDASFQIRQWISEGKIVISNRYVTANMGHQGGKIVNDLERREYFKWLHHLEFDIFGIPKPDLNIILHVEAEVAQKLVDSKGFREYVGGVKRDIHEADLDHLKNAEKVYLEITKSFPDYQLIECTKNKQILSREEIHESLYKNVKNLILNKKADDSLSPAPEKEIKEEIASENKINLNEFKLVVEKIFPDARIPVSTYADDAAFEIYSYENLTLYPGDIIGVHTGIKMSIPQGHAVLIWDKSGLAKSGLKTMGGVIDSGYKGEIIVLAKNLSDDLINIQKGQKIAQFLVQKVEKPLIIEGRVENISERGQGGFGSTGLF